MRKLLIPVLFAFAILLQSNSCKKNNTTPVYNTEFPNNIGTWWKYKVFDSATYLLDTVTINVIANTKLNDGTDVSIWAIKSLINGNDTNYVSNKSDGIRIYHFKFDLNNSPFKKYEFPLNVGKYWITRYTIDTNRITLQGSISVIAGTFNGYRINRDVNIPPGLNRIREEEWFVQNIGMVSRHYNELSGGSGENKKWELVSYFIK